MARTPAKQDITSTAIADGVIPSHMDSINDRQGKTLRVSFYYRKFGRTYTKIGTTYITLRDEYQHKPSPIVEINDACSDDTFEDIEEEKKPTVEDRTYLRVIRSRYPECIRNKRYSEDRMELYTFRPAQPLPNPFVGVPDTFTKGGNQFYSSVDTSLRYTKIHSAVTNEQDVELKIYFQWSRRYLFPLLVLLFIGTIFTWRAVEGYNFAWVNRDKVGVMAFLYSCYVVFELMVMFILFLIFSDSGY
ncbi:hypothetical protein TWF696_009483 [Orbilia brochopaga]|uniref:Uncharacterized protein n=1 Tax=Orbilia brochopaga TaxID=3140254 RepID=A0AAV9UCB1_9PEZI